MEKALRYTLFFSFLFALAIWGWRVANCITFPFPLSYPEGSIALVLANADLGFPLFSPLDSLPNPAIHVPYPPSIFWILAPFFQDALWLQVGRALSATSALAVALLFFFRSRKISVSAALGLAAAFLLLPPVYRLSGNLRVDLIALAFTAFGWHFYLKDKSNLLAALFLFAAFAFKQNYLISPLVMLAVELVRGKKILIPVLFFVFSSLWLIVLHLFSAGQSTLHLFVHHAIPFDANVGLIVSSDILIPLTPLILFLLLVYRRSSGNLKILVVYSAVAAPASVFSSAKLGAEDHYGLELGLALLFAASKALNYDSTKTLVRPVLLLSVLCFLPLPEPNRVSRTYADLSRPASAAGSTPTSADVRNYENLLGALRGTGQPILSENGVWSVLVRSTPVIDAFQSRWLAREGRFDESPVIRMIQDKSFKAIVTRARYDLQEDGFFSPKIQQALVQNYQWADSFGPHHLFVPARENP